MFRRLGSSLANHRASLSSELGSLWDFIRSDRDRDRVRDRDRARRRSAPAGTYEPIPHESKSPVRLARDLLQVVQETVFSKKFEETPKRCPLVQEESDLTSSDDDDGDRRIANLIDFFFTIVRSQKEDRKSSVGTCCKSEVSPVDDRKEVYIPAKVNTELEQKMETLIEFLAISGCMDADVEVLAEKEERKITLMEFLFGADDKLSPKPLIEINDVADFNKGISLSESNINVENLSFIDETPVEEGSETLVEMLMKYMDNYSSKEKMKETKSMSLTPSLSEKSKSDITISKLENFSDMSKTKSDSTLTTQDTVIDRGEDYRSDKSRRISETVIDLSNVKQDLEDIFDEAVGRVCEAYAVKQLNSNDTMTVQEDIENYNAYTNPALQYLPYSVELSDILEEDEPSSRDFERKLSEDDRLSYIKHLAVEIVNYIEDRVANYNFEDSEEEFDVSQSLKRSSISLIDLRNIPDLPPSLMVKPKVDRVDKSTSTTEISDAISDLSKRIDLGCMTDDTTLTSSSERTERVLDKLESLTRFFSKSRLKIIDESLEENGDKKSPNNEVFETETTSDRDREEYKAGQASLDDVEDIQDDTDVDRHFSCDKKDDANIDRHDSDAKKSDANIDRHDIYDKKDDANIDRHDSDDKKDDAKIDRNESDAKKDDTDTDRNGSHCKDETVKNDGNLIVLL